AAAFGAAAGNGVRWLAGGLPSGVGAIIGLGVAAGAAVVVVFVAVLLPLDGGDARALVRRFARR
ncbi:MAG: hypothetical protein HOV76_25970, partial [Hamadaea sp.]|nr:hypothetical protein [Hamadaea sp.]